jgi:hypothetical protein
VKTTIVDCKTFALNVLAGSLFSVSYPFQQRMRAPTHTIVRQNASASQYRESLVTITRNLLPVLGFGGQTLTSRFSSKKYQRIGAAVEDFRSYVMELVAEERVRVRPVFARIKVSFRISPEYAKTIFMESSPLVPRKQGSQCQKMRLSAMCSCTHLAERTPQLRL